MKPNGTPSIHSFVIRFVVEEAPAGAGEQPAYHGAIRHIQSAEEMNFINWVEAIDFMRHYVPLEENSVNKREDNHGAEAQPEGK